MSYELHPTVARLVSAQRVKGLPSSIAPSDGRGLQIHIPGPNRTYALVGCDVDLPAADETPDAVHAQLHREDGEFLALVYHACTSPACAVSAPGCTRAGGGLDLVEHAGPLADALAEALVSAAR
ncbi:hypothetical protein [Kitasatospora sp. NPDC088783]|uniref:hypothetical protein n=1 Tax=Kitasatospora sp. NPDC088783 TaxID=3364077 RepID=UPI0038309EF0